MRKKFIVILAWLLVLIVSIGCTNNKKISSEDTEENINNGGYVEEIITVSDDLNYIVDITKLDNGDLIVWAQDNDLKEKVFVSSDNGISWIEKEIKHLTFENKVKYKTLNLLNNGNILIVYVFEDGVKYAMSNENGEVTAIDLDVKQEMSSEGLNYAPIYFTTLNNGDLIYSTMTTNEVVQIDGSTLKEKFRFDGGSMYSFTFNLGDKVIIESENTVSVYDTNTGQPMKNLESKLIRNDELGAFINSTSDKSLYTYSTEGLYSYDLDKNENKILIDNSKYIANPDNSVDKLIELEKDSYITLISSTALSTNKLIKYSYDPNYVKEENSDIIIYSLIENEDVRRKIAMYQSNNPNIEIEYEVGISSNDGVEVSDAIKTLNTELATGKGPDIILLDGLPADSFIENELLADISDIIYGNEKEVFEGIVNSYKVNGIINQIPLYIKVPTLISNKDIVSKINNIDSLLSVIKEYAQKSDNRIFSNLGTPEDFITSLYCVYGDNLIVDGKFNTDNLIKFINVAKEIYNIAKEKDDIFWKNQMEIMGIEDYDDIEIASDSKINILPTINVREVIYPIDKALLGYGSISNNYNIEDIVNMQIAKPEFDYKILTCDTKNVFVPYNNIAINKNTKNLDVSKDIVKSFIEEAASRGNFTIYKTNFINMLQMNQESDYNESNHHYVKYVETDFDANGNKIEYPQYWANENDINKFVAEFDKLNVAVEFDMTILNEVATQFKSVIQENLDVKKAVSNVVSNLEIYLAE